MLIEKPCRSLFPNPLNRPDLRKTDWSNFQACLEAGLPSNPDLPNEVAIDACAKELSSIISKALTHSTPKCCPRDDPRPPMPDLIQGEIV
jgi:hypothetical protein